MGDSLSAASVGTDCGPADAALFRPLWRGFGVTVAFSLDILPARHHPICAHIARVTGAGGCPGDDPLLYCDGRFGRFAALEG